MVYSFDPASNSQRIWNKLLALSYENTLQEEETNIDIGRDSLGRRLERNRLGSALGKTTTTTAGVPKESNATQITEPVAKEKQEQLERRQNRLKRFGVEYYQ